MKSMTGFGRAEMETAKAKVTVEIRSLNHRFLDISVYVGRRYHSLEQKIKELISQTVLRGKIDIWLNIKEKEGIARKPRLNKDVLKACLSIIKELEKEGIKGEITWDKVLALPDVMEFEEESADAEELFPLIKDAISKAMSQLEEMRRTEGEKIRTDISGILKKLSRLVDEIKERTPAVVIEHKERLMAALKELSDAEVNDEKVAQEVAIFAEKSDITEELTRLQSHIHQALEATDKEGGAVGRKLDFLAQEMHREINTAGTKANDALVSERVVTFKCELEKLREISQNVE